MRRPASPGELLDNVRQRQRAWLDKAQEATRSPMLPRGLSLTDIARRAGVSQTTLTRFRNDSEYDGTLSALTIQKVAQVTGYPATLEALGQSEDAPDGLREPEAAPFRSEPDDEATARMVRAAIEGRNGVDPWELRTRALEAEGYRAGDVLIVDLNATPASGDLVCLQIYDFQTMRAETVFRFYEAPFFLGVGAGSDRKPMLESDRNIGVKGVVIASLRRRGAR